MVNFKKAPLKTAFSLFKGDEMTQGFIKTVSKLNNLKAGLSFIFYAVLSFFMVFIIFQEKAQAYVLGQIETKGLSFISPDYGNTDKASFLFLGASLKSYNSQADLFKINLDAQYAAGTPVLSYVNLKEIYFTVRLDSESQIHIGRKLLPLSEADESWNLGLFQPQFRWNPLQLESQGVFGIFYDKKKSAWQLSLFGSPFFIPDQGPSYELKEGRFESSNPYFTPPPQNIYFQNVLLPIDYNIQKPQVDEVVLQPSYSASLKYGNDTGYEMQLSGAYKPSYQFAFGYKGVLVTDRVRVDVLPKTYYEKLLGFDQAYKWAYSKVGISVIHNQVEPATFSTQYNKPIFNKSTVISPYIYMRLTDDIETQISGLYIDQGLLKEEGPDAGQFEQSLTQKYLWTQGFQVQLTYNTLWIDKLKYQSTVVYRHTEKNLLKKLTWAQVFDLKGPWKMTFDLILVETNNEVTQVSNYRNLDQAWLGVTYVF